MEKGGLSKDDLDTRTLFVRCDLTDIADVNRVADHLLTKLDRLNILINDAALPIVPEYTLSPQGIETTFATNRVVLTNILLPLIERTAAAAGSARIVNTSSSLHTVYQELNLSLVTSPTQTKSPPLFDSTWRYGCSKLANILLWQHPHRGHGHLEAALRQITGTLFKSRFQVIGQSSTKATATALFLAVSKDVETRDLKSRYFVPIAAEHKTSPLADDKDLAKICGAGVIVRSRNHLENVGKGRLKPYLRPDKTLDQREDLPYLRPGGSAVAGPAG